MSQGCILLTPEAAAKELKAKRKLVEVKELTASELPFRVIKRRTGVVLGGFKDRDEVTRFLKSIPLATLAVKPTRKKYERIR